MPLVLRVATAVDVGAAPVALVVILVNVSVVDVHVGRMCIATVPGRAPRAARAHARPPEDGQGSVSNGPARHVPDAAGSLAHEAAV